MLRVEEGARALRNQTGKRGGGGDGGVWMRSLVCVVVGTSKPETIARRNKSPFRVEPAPLISPVRIILDPPAADHPIKELPCILHQTPRTLVVYVSLLLGGVASAVRSG